MANGSKAEIELAIRDSMSEALRTIAREMSDVNKRAQEMASAGSALDNVDKLLNAMTSKLASPFGLAGAFVAVSKALDSFAVGQLQLRNFAADTGFTVEQVTRLRQQLALSGVPFEQAQKAMGSFAAKMQEVTAFPYGAELIKQVQITHPALARQLIEIGRVGDVTKAGEAIFKEFITNNKAGQANLILETGLSRTEILAFGKDVTGMIKPWHESTDAAEEYYKKVVNTNQAFENVWKSLADNALKRINEIGGGWEGMDKAAHAVADTINNEVNKAFKDFLVIAKDIMAFIEWLDKRGPQGRMNVEDVPKITWRQWLTGKGPRGSLGMQELTEDEAQRSGARSGVIPDQTEPAKEGWWRERSGNELTIIQKNSSDVLIDIRDILKKMWEKIPQSRQEGGPVEAGQEYQVGEAGPEMFAASGQYRMVGEEGPEIIKPRQSGRIFAQLDEAAREWQPPSVESSVTSKAISKVIPGPFRMAAQTAKQADPDTRTWLRKTLGLEERFGFQDKPGEPPPWSPAGEWSGRGQAGSGADLREKDTPAWGNEPLRSREADTPAWSEDAPERGALASGRARFREELQDPKLREQLFRRTTAENPEEAQAFMESVMNRASARGRTLAQTINDKRYFPAVSLRGEDPGRRRGIFEKAQLEALSGSNISGYATGNYSVIPGQPGRWPGAQVGERAKGLGGGVVTYQGRPGEYYGTEGNPRDVRWREAINRALMENRSIGNLNAEVVFKNVPPGVKTSADFDGFDQSRVSSSKQMASNFTEPVVP